MFILVFIIVLLLLISLTSVNIHILFHRIYNDDSIIIKLSLLLGLVKFKFKIPYIDIIFNSKLKPGIKLKEKLNTKDSILSEKKSILNIRELKSLYYKAERTVKLYKNVLIYFLSKLHLVRIKWYTEIGLDDAALTAISTGVIYSIKGNIISMLSNNASPDEIDIYVKPNYSKAIFEVDLNGIIRIKIANIIIAGIRFVYLYLVNSVFKKGGEVNEPAPYRRANENYNG